MLRVIWAQLVRRGSRSLALLLGLLVACAGFTVLTSQTRSATAQVRGTVNAHVRSAYDLLVRPPGSRSPLERRDGLVQAGFLSGVRGGISLAQWRTIQKIPGVQVAAPVAVIGYVIPHLGVSVNLPHVVEATPGRVLLRGEQTWHTDAGASTVVARPSFAYVTPKQTSSRFTSGVEVTRERGADGTVHVICRYPSNGVWTVQSGPTEAGCLPRTEYLRLARQHQLVSALDVTFPFPFLIEAIDPASEAKLAGLKGAMVSGQYLEPTPQRTRKTVGRLAAAVPVIVAAEPATHLSVDWQVKKLPAAAARAVSNGRGVDSQLHTPGTVVAGGHMDEGRAYRMFLAQLGKHPAELSYLYTTGQPSYRTTGTGTDRRLHVRTVHNERGVWANPLFGDVAGTLIPAGGDDTAFRPMAGYQWNPLNENNYLAPVCVKEGTFDASTLPGYSDLSSVPLGTYASTRLTGATTRARRTLGGEPLPPSSNIAGYPQPAPLMLTTLQALPAFEQDTGFWTPLSGDRAGTPYSPVSTSAPISSIRVRVAGVTGVDPVSRERVRLVAAQIAAKTHLTVDVTVGSSPSPETIVLPAGRHGRPQLVLAENWVKKGVALAILTAVNKKSVALFVLVLVVCALFVANTTAASVRARRAELGVLACVGWSKARLFALVAGELTMVGLAAGIGGGLLAWGAGAALGAPITITRASLAVPAALVVALTAGILPAWRAAQAPPLEAVQPGAAAPKRAEEPTGITGLAWVNVRRTRGRSALAAAGLAIAVAALTVIIGVVSAFRGAVVGSLLGNAVAVQVRGADYAAVAAIVVLAGVGVANVLFLNIRERGPELATLRALGWTEAWLHRLLLTEGLFIGFAGALAGAVLGLAILIGFLGSLPTAIILAGLVAVAAGTAVALLATVPPIWSLRLLPTAQLLTEE